MHPSRISAPRFRRALAVILALVGLVSAAVLMPGVVGAALKASHPAIPAAGEALASYPAQGPNNGKNQLVYNSGPVITNPQAYLIFEGSTWQQPYSGTQTNMQRVQQYFHDVSGSALEGILTQYYYIDSNNTRHYISNTISVAGSVLDLNFSYSNHCQGTKLLYDPGTTASPNDIADEITKEINANHWTNSASAIFFVFTPQDYSLALQGINQGCGGPFNFCGYHMTNVGYNYAAITNQTGTSVSCAFGNTITDSMIDTASHEQFEAITDPDQVLYAYGTGWNNDDCNQSPGDLFPGCEIGDKCEASSDPNANTHPGVYLNGTSYPGVQGEFSNATHDCEYTVQPPPTPTPTHTPVTRCSVTNETDNIEPGGTYTDNRGNTWHVYYDIKRDATTNKPCQMRVVVRIFNPSPDGAWSGTAAVFALVNGGYNGASFGKVSGSCTYQYHFVWRGPWFGVSQNLTSYHIEDTEYNGSNPYTRAYANFSV
jgi:hypothetical protein